jgi:hypothetical protein
MKKVIQYKIGEPPKRNEKRRSLEKTGRRVSAKPRREFQTRK